jgi:AcrR family transcriptional regulator
MASTRRIGSENSETRTAILKAALDVLQDKGGGHFTASAIAKRAGLKAHMVHYYFRSIDDLVLALVKMLGATGLKNSARAIATDNPLKAIWDIELGSKLNVAVMELGTLAVHRADIRAEMGRYVEELRIIQGEAVARFLELRGIAAPVPPMALTMVISAIARQLVRERDFGVSLGHAELEEAVEALLTNFPTAKAMAPPA